MIEELLKLLSSDDLAPDELAAAVATVEGAPDDPELEWLDDPQRATAYEIMNVLDDFIAEGDKIDEVHEVLDTFFTDSLPPFPYDDEAIQQDVGAYFSWMDGLLADRNPQAGGYALVDLDVGLDDNLHLLVVLRKDVARILALAADLGIRITRMDGQTRRDS